MHKDYFLLVVCCGQVVVNPLKNTANCMLLFEIKINNLYRHKVDSFTSSSRKIEDMEGPKLVLLQAAVSFFTQTS